LTIFFHSTRRNNHPDAGKDSNQVDIIDSQDSLLTLEEAASILHIHPETLRRWDRNGEFPAIKIGKRQDRRYSKIAILRALNQQSTPKFRVVSLFSGCGGFDLGFQGDFEYLRKYYPPTGFTVIWANDIDPQACLTYRNNLRADRVICGDIAKIIKRRKIPDCEIIIGGFPCQDFSIIARRRGIAAKRGNLYQFFVHAVSEKQPMAFIAENVKGILSTNSRADIQQIIHDFQKCGYTVSFYICNCADYGVPQLRKRVIIAGIRNDLPHTFTKPVPTHIEKSYISSAKALQNVANVQYNNELPSVQERTKTIISLIPEGGNFLDIPEDSPYQVKGMVSLIYRRLHRDRPSSTIIANGGGGTWGYHYEQPRPLTNRERARLFSYPDNFIFSGSISHVRRQIGNSVPPVFAWHIAEALAVSLSTV
jgi:DNA (cytosine-5)-methyltransferase 1